MDAIIKNFEVDQVFISNGSSTSKTYMDFVYAMLERGVTPSVPLENIKIGLGENQYMQFYNIKEANGQDVNDLSIVTRFVDENNSFLFMGDASQKVENELLETISSADVLKVGHHGSKTATSEDFLKVVKPKNML